MTTSPSQCVTVDRCNRRWFFEKVVQLRLPDSKPQAFGHSLHYLCAAALDGREVVPTWAENLTNDEVEECLEFRDLALAKGVLVKRPGLLCEHDFRMPIAHEEMHGIIDVLDLGGVVEDHKVVAAARWAKCKADLLTDIPMMIYAGYLLQREPSLTQVVLRHNQFIRDQRRATWTEVTVPRDQVRAFWGRRIMPLLKTMDATRGVEQWADVPGQERKSDACTAYGGCPFHSICHGGLPLEQFGTSKPEENGAPF